MSSVFINRRLRPDIYKNLKFTSIGTDDVIKDALSRATGERIKFDGVLVHHDIPEIVVDEEGRIGGGSPQESDGTGGAGGGGGGEEGSGPGGPKTDDDTGKEASDDTGSEDKEACDVNDLGEIHTNVIKGKLEAIKNMMKPIM